MKKNFSLAVVLFVLLSIGWSDFSSDILRRETGVRALGMGGTFTAVADDTSALFYNPAGLAKVGFQFSYMEDDLNHRSELRSAVEDVIKFGNFAYGRRKYIDNDLNFTEIHSYGFGSRTPLGIDYGLVFKKVVQENPDTEGSGWATDVGMIFHVLPDFNVGFNAQNISAANLDLKPSARIGLAKEYGPVRLLYDHETFSQDDRPNSVQSHYGLEWEVADGFALRGGLNDKKPTYGISVGIFGFIWDYAFEQDDREVIYRFAAKIGSEKYPQVRKYALIKKKDFMVLDLTQPLIAGQSDYSLFGGLSLGADYLLNKIRLAAEDKDITGILIKLDDLPNSLSYVGLIQELRTELLNFKAKGKYIVVYVEGEISQNSYYLASCADKIVMSKMGAVYAVGKSLTVTRYAGLLDKLGLNYQVLKSGEYKDALNPFNRGFTAKQKEHIQALVFDLNEQAMTDIRASRLLTTVNITEVNDGGIISATKALKYGLIDEIGYYDKAAEMMKKVANLDYEPGLVKVEELPSYDLDDALWPDFNTIALLDIDGQIMTGKTKNNFLFGGKSVGSDTIIDNIKKIAERDDIKAVVVRVNSPGGMSIASDMIYQKLMELREKKKYIVVSMGNIAASGGYYIACAGNKIIANKGTLTGSIGVIGEVWRGPKLYEMLGIKEENIKTGEHMDMESFGRTLNAQEIKMFNDYQNEVYEDFKLIVAKARNLHIEDVEKLAQGKIYSGKTAKDIGLVDQIGTLYDAIDVAKAGANISGKAKVIRFVDYQDYGWLTLRSRFASMLGLDSLNLNNMKQNNFAEFNSFIY